MIRFIRILTVCGLVVATGLIASKSWRSHESLDRLGPVGTFSFQGRDGKPVSDRDLRGKVYVIACFFTCCTETCPQITGSMAKLQSDLSNLKDVRLVSLTVDPEHDTPEKLDAYAKTFGADPARWLFLTGEREKVETFVRGQLKQGVEENKGADRTPGNKMLHSNMLVLVDGEGEIRGFYRGTEPESVEALERAVRDLHR